LAAAAAEEERQRLVVERQRLQREAEERRLGQGNTIHHILMRMTLQSIIENC
jgi:hypothetical protein